MQARRAPDTRQGIWALVPIKSFAQAKKRLAGQLSEEERRALITAMSGDVLAALSESQRLAGVLIVSRSPEAEALAKSFGARWFAESAGSNLPGALEEAAALVTRRYAATGIFVVPVDVPLIRAEEIDALLEHHRHVTLLPDQEQIGTNGLICSPPDAIPLIFDGRSFAPHLEAAVEAGITPEVVADGGFVLDVDRPRDLARLLSRGPGTQTAAFLQQSGIAARLPADIES